MGWNPVNEEAGPCIAFHTTGQKNMGGRWIEGLRGQAQGEGRERCRKWGIMWKWISRQVRFWASFPHVAPRMLATRLPPTEARDGGRSLPGENDHPGKHPEMWEASPREGLGPCPVILQSSLHTGLLTRFQFLTLKYKWISKICQTFGESLWHGKHRDKRFWRKLRHRGIRKMKTYNLWSQSDKKLLHLQRQNGCFLKAMFTRQQQQIQ